MGFTTLGLMLGYKCNIRCRSCLWGRLPADGPSMPVSEACAWVDQAYDLGDLILVGFSGGEPFLYLEEMTAISRYAHEKYGLETMAATNCFWAVTPQKAESRLKPLYDLGLRRLLVSVDDFHQEWLPLSRVKNCLLAAQTLGIECTLQCVVTASSRKLSHYLEALGVTPGDSLTASEMACTPVGSAADMIPKSEFILHPGVPSDYCTLLQALIVRPEGTVNLCCGPAFNLAGLDAGNLRQEKLSAIIERAEWNPLFNALALGNGPCQIAKALTAVQQDAFLLEGYASSCHACYHILSQPGIESILMEVLEPQQAELFLKRTILDQITGDRTGDVLNI